MIRGAPSLLSWALSRRATGVDARPADLESRPEGPGKSGDTSGTVGFEAFVERYVDRYWLYGSGKAALRDGLAGAVDDGTVVVPSYLPDAVGEPFRDLGLAVDRYAVEADLGPDLADLESRLSDAVAVLTVDYFGFPAPRFEAVADLADDRGCVHVDDAAHGAASVVDGAPLGTRGDLGIASLRKLFPVPDGAVLYVDDGLAGSFEPSALSGVDGYGARDVRFVLASLASEARSVHPALERSIDALVAARGADPSAVSPRERYEAAKAPMSALSRRVLAGVDPDAVRAARRANYRAWERAVADLEGVSPRYDRLPDGVCPMACPVVADRPAAFLADLERAGVDGAHTWPRLHETVRDDPTYGTANRLSRRLVALPVHQHLDPGDVESAGRRLLE